MLTNKSLADTIEEERAPAKIVKNAKFDTIVPGKHYKYSMGQDTKEFEQEVWINSVYEDFTDTYTFVPSITPKSIDLYEKRK